MKKYVRVWWLLGLQAAKTAFTSRFGAISFIAGKVIRFLLFLSFILLIATKVEHIAGYTLWQMVLFFATFNLIDTITQLFLREVYRFRTYVVSGDFDYILAKPLSPLFRCLFGGMDVLDIPLFFLSLGVLVFASFQLGGFSFYQIGIFMLFVVNALFIAVSFHICVLAIGILTTEVDNTLWLYRDITQMGRIPIDVYKEPLRGFLTFIIPVGIMMTFPAQALMGVLTMHSVALSFMIGVLFFAASIFFWRFSLKRYASASS